MSVTLVVIAACANAQVFTNGPSASLKSLTGWTGNIVVQDVEETPSQVRYLVGRVDNSTFVMRLGKNGNLRFAVIVANSASTESNIAVYGENEVFVALNLPSDSGSGSRLLKLDDKGNVSIDKLLGPDDRIEGLVTLPDGRLGSGGSMRFGPFGPNYAPCLAFWDRNWNNLTESFVAGGGGGVHSVYNDSLGNLYGEGVSIGGNEFVCFASFDALYTTSLTVSYSNRQVTGYGIEGMSFDPVNRVALGFGYYTSDYEDFPRLFMLKVDYVPGQEPVVVKRIISPIPDEGYIDAVAPDNLGNFFVGVDPLPGLPYISKMSLTADGQNLNADWMVPAVDYGAYFPGPDGGLLIAGDNLSLVGANGESLQRPLLGDPLLQPTGVSHVIYSQSHQELFALSNSSLDASPVTLFGEFLSGPKDTYEIPVADSGLTVDVLGGVLTNDAPGIPSATLTAALETKGKGIKSITVNPDGSFSLIKKTGFKGLGGFTYRQYRDGVPGMVVDVTVDCHFPAPVAVNDVYSVAMNSAPVNFAVMANDTQEGGIPIKIVAKTGTEHGTVTLPDSHHVRFKPKPGFVGDAVFTYTIENSQGRAATATVTVHVGP